MVVIVDYKAGNLGSIVNMLNNIGTKAVISDVPDDILKAEKLMSPVSLSSSYLLRLPLGISMKTCSSFGTSSPGERSCHA